MSCDSCSWRSGEARGLCEGDAEASTRSVRAVDSATTDSATAETVGEGPGWTRGTMSILDCSSSMAGSSWWVARLRDGEPSLPRGPCQGLARGNRMRSGLKRLSRRETRIVGEALRRDRVRVLHPGTV